MRARCLSSRRPCSTRPTRSGSPALGRLHDLFVTHEAVTPGTYRARGEGLVIRYGFHPSPFGTALVMATEYGLAGLAFADEGEETAALADMMRRWPKAEYVEDDAGDRTARAAASSTATNGGRRRRSASS